MHSVAASVDQRKPQVSGGRRWLRGQGASSLRSGSGRGGPFGHGFTVARFCAATGRAQAIGSSRWPLPWPTNGRRWLRGQGASSLRSGFGRGGPHGHGFTVARFCAATGRAQAIGSSRWPLPCRPMGGAGSRVRLDPGPLWAENPALPASAPAGARFRQG